MTIRCHYLRAVIDRRSKADGFSSLETNVTVTEILDAARRSAASGQNSSTVPASQISTASLVAAAQLVRPWAHQPPPQTFPAFCVRRKASGNPRSRSVATNECSPTLSRITSPASPCRCTAARTAHNASFRILRNHCRATIPVRMSPVPPVDIPGFPVVFDPGLAIRLDHQSAMSLEHDNHFVFARKLSAPLPIDLSARRQWSSRQPRHLARMRSDHQSPPLPFNSSVRPSNAFSPSASSTSGNSVLLTSVRTNSEVSGFARDSRPDREHALPFRQRFKPLTPRSPQSCPRRFLAAAPSSTPDEIPPRSPAQTSPSPPSPSPAPSPQRRHPRHRSRTSFADRSPDHQHVTVVPFVRFRRTRPNQRRKIARSNHVQMQRRDDRLSRRPDPRHISRPSRKRPKTCAGRGAVNVTIASARAMIPALRAHRVRIGAGRNIDRDHRNLARIQIAIASA